MGYKKDIRQLNSGQLEEFFINKNHKKYRVNQISDWVWNKGVDNFSKMSNISDGIVIGSSIVGVIKNSKSFKDVYNNCLSFIKKMMTKF